MGSFLKFFREGAVLYVNCMGSQSKPPVELVSLLSVKESPLGMVIWPCMGNRQSNWRVPTARHRRRGGQVRVQDSAKQEWCSREAVVVQR